MRCWKVRSAVAFDQAENKMHIHKAILEKHMIGSGLKEFCMAGEC